MITLIIARSRNGVIGQNGDLPWHMPADLKRFRTLTSGHSVIMGRKTYDSFVKHRSSPLPDRRNIVVSGHLKELLPGFELAGSLTEAVTMTKDEPQTFIIGGATLFTQAIELGLADTVELTIVDTEVEGDAAIDDLDPARWELTNQEGHQVDDKNEFAYQFLTYKKK